MFCRIGSAALGLWLIAGVPSGLAQGTPEPPTSESQPAPDAGERNQPAPEAGERTRGEQTASQPADADRLISALNAALDRAIRDLTAEEGTKYRQLQEQRDEADLRAQHNMAWWAGALFWAAVVSLVPTMVGLWLLQRTLIHTKRTAHAAVSSVEEARKSTVAAAQAANAASEGNQIQRQTLIVAERAWLKVKSAEITSDMTWVKQEKQTGDIHFRFTIENIGRTAALNVMIHPELRQGNVYYADPTAARRHAAALPQRLQTTDYPHAVTLFPADTFVQKWICSIPDADLIGNRDPTKKGWHERIIIAPILIVCVNYELAFATQRHQTWSVYTLSSKMKGAKSEFTGAMIPIYGPIPLDQLLLEQIATYTN
jgi:hypothetical protein